MAIAGFEAVHTIVAFNKNSFIHILQLTHYEHATLHVRILILQHTPFNVVVMRIINVQVIPGYQITLCKLRCDLIRLYHFSPQILYMC